ncbi:hypothetical protein B0H63DRAFT_447628 [Podospora didyma]|uniref:FAD-binding PCMH-type domain-containing protein n=1 Tax=Podospora didyma TaxID=330526 RepID=A0AAE0NSG7_9PEZI|nr:hypothetical protein B0H63DRAFT_447628 [Podospora didyma]
MQGRHGFSADNLVSARVVLANGSAVTASAGCNPDLFRAIRGAGHNFGITTSLEDKLERFFNTWNRLEVKHHDLGSLILNGVFLRNPAVDVDHVNYVQSSPVISLPIFYEGEHNVANEYTSAFFALGPVSNLTVANIAYGDLHDVGGFGLESSECRKGENLLGHPNSSTRSDTDAMRAGFDLFSEITGYEKFVTSAWLLESYGRKGVVAVPAAENAIAPEDRFLHILTPPILWWPGGNKQGRDKAVWYGERMQEAVRRNGLTLPHAYVNYAVGREQLPEAHGRESARFAKLKRLKGIYDPHNRFRFYTAAAAVVPAGAIPGRYSSSSSSSSSDDGPGYRYASSSPSKEEDEDNGYGGGDGSGGNGPDPALQNDLEDVPHFEGNREESPLTFPFPSEGTTGQKKTRTAMIRVQIMAAAIRRRQMGSGLAWTQPWEYEWKTSSDAAYRKRKYMQSKKALFVSCWGVHPR